MDFVIFKLTCLCESRELLCLYLLFSTMPLHVQIKQGRIQDFKLGEEHLKKSRRAEGDAKIVGVFRGKKS